MTCALSRAGLLSLLLSVLACDSDAPNSSEDANATVAAAGLPEDSVGFSFLGEPLYPPTQSGAVLAANEARLAEALADLEAAPGNADAIIWAGRRHAYLGHYRTAIDVYSEGMALHPDDARFLRQRGHRYISVRDLDAAVADLQAAVVLVEGREDEVEPDGQPNRLNIPLSTLHLNIWYHLGLAHYLQGDFELARAAYREAYRVSRNDDSRIGASYWLYLTLRRLSRDAEAAEILELVTDDLEIIENTAYHEALLLFKGERTPEDLLSEDEDALQSVTVAYGVGAWYAVNGDTERAGEIWEGVLETGSEYAFGYIAAEAELARMGRVDGRR
jgi:tetratricopeptide (TPR) repeat protein